VFFDFGREFSRDCEGGRGCRANWQMSMRMRPSRILLMAALLLVVAPARLQAAASPPELPDTDEMPAWAAIIGLFRTN
jgi:hypothetical protein